LKYPTGKLKNLEKQEYPPIFFTLETEKKIEKLLVKEISLIDADPKNNILKSS
jgi:hypothetical protein